MRFELGERVVVSTGHHWAQGAKGRIVMPPRFARELVKDESPWDGWHRYFKGREKMFEFYFVKFDEAQLDADGDGPYTAGEIDADMLHTLS